MNWENDRVYLSRRSKVRGFSFDFLAKRSCVAGPGIQIYVVWIFFFFSWRFQPLLGIGLSQLAQSCKNLFDKIEQLGSRGVKWKFILIPNSEKTRRKAARLSIVVPANRWTDDDKTVDSFFSILISCLGNSLSDTDSHLHYAQQPPPVVKVTLQGASNNQVLSLNDSVVKFLAR